MENEVKIEHGYRAAIMVPATVNNDKRTVDVTFGTEAHVLRYDWRNEQHFYEELGYNDGEVDMMRLTSGAAPVLDNHSSYGGARSVLGVVENARLEGVQGAATLRFSKRDDVEPIYQDVLDGIVRTVSVGYRVSEYSDTGRKAVNGYPILRATSWEPMEISLAPIAADPRSRVRAEGVDSDTSMYSVRVAGGIATTVQPSTQEGAKPVTGDEDNAARAAAAAKTAGANVQPKSRPKMKDVNEMKARLAELKNELVRLDTITKNGGELTEEQESRQAAAVDEIETLDGKVNNEERRVAILASRAAAGEGSSAGEQVEIRKMAKRASLGDQVVRLLDGKELDGVVGELHREAGGSNSMGISIPTTVIHAMRSGTADNFQIDAGQGSAFKPTEVPSFIEKIFAPFEFERQGATVLSGLVGKQQFPRQKTHGTAHARTEVAATVNAGLELDELIMDARRYTAKTTYSKKLLVQSPLNFDSIIANLLRRGFERKFEQDCYIGEGNPEEVVGIFNQAGVNAPTITDGTAWADIAAALYEASIRGEADLARSSYVASPKVWRLFNQAAKVADVNALIAADGSLNGRQMLTTPYLPDASATLGRLALADFSQVYLGFWGSYDLVIDPYTLAETNQIKLVGNMYTDLGLANPSAISITDDISAT